MFFFSFDYMIFMLPAMLLAGLATLYTRTTFNRYQPFWPIHRDFYRSADH